MYLPSPFAYTGIVNISIRYFGIIFQYFPFNYDDVQLSRNPNLTITFGNIKHFKSHKFALKTLNKNNKN